jgi:Cys-tRNA(Pro)/Cys-tRNA(Cys) deacylase
MMGRKMANEKTNVMRLLEQQKIMYKKHSYLHSRAVSGEDVARALAQDMNTVYKTLLTKSRTGHHYVFMIPVQETLDLRKAAKAVGEKSIEMIKEKELLPLTGYVHGGCSPIGMKKKFPTVIDARAKTLVNIFFSAGKIGYQVKLHMEDLERILAYTFADVIAE